MRPAKQVIFGFFDMRFYLSPLSSNSFLPKENGELPSPSKWEKDFEKRAASVLLLLGGRRWLRRKSETDEGADKSVLLPLGEGVPHQNFGAGRMMGNMK